MPADPAPRAWPLVLVFVATSLVQKLTNNFEGLTRVRFRVLARESPEEGGLGLDEAGAGAFFTAAALGYCIKPLFGLVSDRVPLFGYRRKSWIVAASLGTSLAWVAVALTGTTEYVPLLAALMAVNVTVTFADVACDGLMVEAGQAAEAAGGAPPGLGSRPYQTAQWAAALGAMLLSALTGAALAAAVPLATLAWVSAVLPVIPAAVVMLCVTEARVAFDWRAARPGFAALGLACVVGAAVVGLKNATAGTPYQTIESFASPLLVVGAVLLLVRLPASLVGPALLVVLWQAVPLKGDSQYFFSYMTAPDGPMARAVADSRVVGGVLAPVAERLNLDAASRPTLFYGSAFLVTELVAGIAGVALVGRYGGRARLPTLLFGVLGGWVLVLASYYSLSLAPAPGLALVCAATGGFVLWGGNSAILFYAAGTVPRDDPDGSGEGGTSQATAFALLMGLSNLGGIFGVETVGNRIYQSAGGSAGGLIAVVLASAGFVLLLAAMLTVFSRRGLLSPKPGGGVT